MLFPSKRGILVQIAVLAIPLFIFMSVLWAQNDKTKDNKAPKTGKNNNALFKAEDFVPLDMGEEIKKRIYPEEILEDFENTEFKKEHLRFQYSHIRQAGVSMRTEYPAPIRNSKRYLGIKIFGRREDAVQIQMPKPIFIPYMVKRLNVWLYGKNITGSFYMVVQDIYENTHLINFGLLNFRGWKRVSVPLPKSVKQVDPVVNMGQNLKIVSFVFNPGTLAQPGSWSYLYVDDFSATVQSKYTDRQSDDW